MSYINGYEGTGNYNNPANKTDLNAQKASSQEEYSIFSKEDTERIISGSVSGATAGIGTAASSKENATIGDILTYTINGAIAGGCVTAAEIVVEDIIDDVKQRSTVFAEGTKVQDENGEDEYILYKGQYFNLDGTYAEGLAQNK